jgi:hypothetical protein
MKFTADHLKAIQNFVEQSPISRIEMRNNIIDHLACAVEYRLLNGFSFEQALETSITEFAPNGLMEIEIETHHLLNAKSIAIKRVLYSGGLLFSICATIGILFRSMHGPNVHDIIRVLLLIGFGGLAAIFIPSIILLQQQKASTPQEKMRLNILLTSIILFSFGWIGSIFTSPVRMKPYYSALQSSV